MDPITLRRSNRWFLVGFGLVNTVVFSFIMLSFSFIAGLNLAAWQFPLSCFLAIVLNWYASKYFFKDEIEPFQKSSLIILAIIVLSILTAAVFYDISADGQMYHMETAIQMLGGWNPFKKELPLDFNQAIWLNHYGKGVEAPQATIFALTHRIETTKATNFIMLAASFCLCMAFFAQFGKFSNRKNILFSLLFAFNPVTFYQLLNTYIDGQLCSFLLCLIAVAALLYLRSNKFYLMLLSVLLIITVNTKFTAIVFAGIFTAGMLLAFMMTKQWQTFKKALIVSSLSAIFAIGVVGYFPYVINITRYHDILYPGLPMLKSEALKFTPPRLRNINQFSKFFISFFSHTDNMHLSTTKDPVIAPKFPFTFNKTDIFNAAKPYVVFIAGMGPFFSGIFLSAVAIFCYWFYRLKNKRAALPVIILAGTVLFSVMIISEAWYVRYVPQLWFIPLILLIATETYRYRPLNKIRYFLYTLMLVNISFCLASFPYVYFKTTEIKYELEQLKASHQNIPVEFTYFTSNRQRFLENHIPFTEVSIPDSTATFMASSSTKIIPPAHLPDLPKPFALRLGNKIVNRFHL